jgi:Ca-activated chloride channel family protein
MSAIPVHFRKQYLWVRWSLLVGLAAFVGILAFGTVRDPHYWMKADRRGDMLMHEKKFSEAAKAYEDPWHTAAAQYRNGDFEAAAKTFARVPGAPGAFNQGNAWLMHGNYDAAIASYDRALGFKPRWNDAEENKAIAIARKKKMEDSGKDRDKESTEAYKPDKIVFDQKGGDKPPEKPKELNGEKMSDEELRASWLRRVQTTPGDFLKAKFAYQASQQQAGETPSPKEGAK